MATLNVKDFPDDLLGDMKDRAKRMGMTFRGWLILTLQGKQVTIGTTPLQQPHGEPTGVRRMPVMAVPSQDDSFEDAELDYSDVPYDDCPPEEKKRRREAALAKRGIGVK